MNLAVAESPTPHAQPLFTDGFGERRQILGARGERLEVLRLSSTLSANAAVESAIRDRTSRLAAFRSESFTHARAVDVEASSGTLLVFSNHVPGIRLASLLSAADKRSVALDINAVRCLLRQLVHAMAAWRDEHPDLPHGAIGPERLIVTPGGRLVVAECVLGAVVDQIRYSRDKYWTDLHVPLPPPPSAPPAFDARTDIAQVGLVALALILGRRLTSDVYPSGLTHALTSASLRAGIGPLEPLSFTFRDWLRRAMQLEPRDSFPTALEAGAALDEAIGEENEALERDALHVFMARCLALDMQADPDPATVTAITELDPEKIDFVTDDVSGDVDLAPRIEALRAFLARYNAPASPGAPLDDALQEFPPSPPLEGNTPGDPSHVDTARLDPMRSEPVDADALDAVLRVPAVPISTLLPGMRVGTGNAAAPVVDEAARRSAAPVHAVWTSRLWIAGGIVLAIVATIGMLLASRYFRSSPTIERGTLSVTTTPAGIPILVDGLRHGVTPIGIELPAGEHLVELITERGRRQFPVTIKPGAQMSQVLELSPTAPAPGTGELQIRTTPAAASVTVDGRFIGRSPVSVGDLAPGAHTVVVSHESGTVTERVVIEAGRAASLLVPLGERAGSTAAGWIAVAAPADVQVFEGGRLLGNNRIDRIMLPIGRHELDIVNETLAYRERRTVQVTPGAVTTVQAQWPSGSLALNAVPWAEVFVDGTPVGETPIGSFKVPVGVHEVVFRHPQLGERRTTVTVAVGAPTKVGIDLGAK